MKHEKKFASIISDKISSINQILNKLTLDINNNLTRRKKDRNKTKNLT